MKRTQVLTGKKADDMVWLASKYMLLVSTSTWLPACLAPNTVRFSDKQTISSHESSSWSSFELSHVGTVAEISDALGKNSGRRTIYESPAERMVAASCVVRIYGEYDVINNDCLDAILAACGWTSVATDSRYFVVRFAGGVGQLESRLAIKYLRGTIHVVCKRISAGETDKASGNSKADAQVVALKNRLNIIGRSCSHDDVCDIIHYNMYIAVACREEELGFYVGLCRLIDKCVNNDMSIVAEGVLDTRVEQHCAALQQDIWITRPIVMKHKKQSNEAEVYFWTGRPGLYLIVYNDDGVLRYVDNTIDAITSDVWCHAMNVGLGYRSSQK